tara:strand:- start:60 stop:770 length:711 start_codon:yes stop_codon:yes gene_type:complete
MKQQLILLCFLNLFISCKKEIVDANRVIDIVPFEQIELNDAFELFVTEGDHYSIEIFGDEKIIDYVDVNVKDKTLIIEDSRGIKWLSPKKNKIKIYVTSLPLKEITAAEGCNIETLNAITSLEFGLILTGKSNEAKLELDCNTFFYWNNFPSGGKVTLSGKTEMLKIWNFAIMSVDAKDLTTKHAIIENNSQGDCEVTVLNKLEYSINEKGNIHLYGNPSEIISNNLISSGRLIQH